MDGLAALFMGLLEEASWEDRVHILHALLRLLPEVSRDLCSRLHGILLYLLNLDQPPSLQVCPSPPHVVPAPPCPFLGLQHQSRCLSVLRSGHRSSL